MKHVLIASGLALLLVTSASAQTYGGTKAQPKAQTQLATVPFLNAANRAGQMEIALAAMAQQQASNARVKAYARMLENDHRQAAMQLDVLASLKGVTLTSPATSPVESVAQLESVKGHAFDVAYVDQMIRDHEQAMKDFQQAASSKDADVSVFASKTLATLQKHLEEARNLKKSL